MAERPDLETLQADLERRTRYAGVRKISDAHLQEVLSYAAALERELGAARAALVEYHAWVEAARKMPTVGPGNWMSPPEHYGEAVRAALAAQEGEP